MEAGTITHAVEIKSGATVATDLFTALDAFERLRAGSQRLVVYGGRDRQDRTAGLVLPWNQVHTVAWNAPPA